jgi:hypothetical protein
MIVLAIIWWVASSDYNEWISVRNWGWGQFIESNTTRVALPHILFTDSNLKSWIQLIVVLQLLHNLYMYQKQHSSTNLNPFCIEMELGIGTLRLRGWEEHGFGLSGPLATHRQLRIRIYSQPKDGDHKEMCVLERIRKKRGIREREREDTRGSGATSFQEEVSISQAIKRIINVSD